MSEIIYVVSHTHWDREWYEPFQVFRLRLVQCVDKLLEIFDSEPEYKHYLLDGQTIVLEDYLEVRPEREHKLRDLVRAGKLDIGPWYILPDTFLVSGESIVRNLQRGIRIAEDFGGAMRIGYIPDPFGHTSQLPQILRGLRMDTAVFRRGLADEPTELWWESSDGTRVLACYLRDSYDNGAWLPHDEAAFSAGLVKLRDSLAPHAVTGNYLVMNGTDHMEPRADLPRLLDAARKEIENTQIVQASLLDYVRAVREEIAARRLQLAVVRGELRNPKRHHLLPGVTSTRMWIKQRNARAQVQLEKWAEPLAAFASFCPGARPSGSDRARSLIRLAWKYLLQNHPHDSICGSGVDRTHADMAPRFDWVQQISDQVVREQENTIAAAVNTSSEIEAVPIVVFNPSLGPRTDHVVVALDLPGSYGTFTLFDQVGRVIPHRLIRQNVEQYYHSQVSAELVSSMLGMAQEGRILGMAIQEVLVRHESESIHVDVTLSSAGEPNRSLIRDRGQQLEEIAGEHPSATFEVSAHSPTQVEVEFVAPDVPAHGYKALFVRTGSRNPASSPFEPGLFLENEFFRVEPDTKDGTLAIADKATGVAYHGANRFVDGGDRGDEYNYCPPENDSLIARPSAPPQIRIERNAVRQSLSISMTYRLNARLADDRSSRSAESVDEEIATDVTIYPGIRRIEFRTVVQNSARDHRLRVEFPTPIITDHACADQAFDVVTRSLDLPTDTAGWIEQPRPEAPMQSFVSVSDGRVGLTLATRGLPEYEVHRGPGGVTIALTLLRSVGWMSRGDLSTRSGDAGPSVETPGAQEIGNHIFEYALLPHVGDWRSAFAEARGFHEPMQAVQTDAHSGPFAPTLSFLDVSPREFEITACKLPEAGTGLIVRGYNAADEAADVRLRLWRTFSRAMRVNLNEDLIAPLPLGDGREVNLRVRAKEIVTFRFE